MLIHAVSLKAKVIIKTCQQNGRYIHMICYISPLNNWTLQGLVEVTMDSKCQHFVRRNQMTAHKRYNTNQVCYRSTIFMLILMNWHFPIRFICLFFSNFFCWCRRPVWTCKECAVCTYAHRDADQQKISITMGTRQPPNHVINTASALFYIWSLVS